MFSALLRNFVDACVGLTHARVLGARFDIKDEFKEAISNYAIYNMTYLKQFKN
ncbi:hypothetical protein MTR_3g117810 [Medicago truncatula]|uniref:Uncharacterized protein n=1 Tax=Medicago truncatula TaxID=3880 RepID=G7J8H7_MEDTR|nr:hypothetical protein MTR_3g117810 [Medicago truncatula]